MIARAPIVPIAELFPFVSVSAGTEDVAFGCQNEIRTDWDFKIGKPRFEQIDRAPGVDCPDRTCTLQFTNQLHALPIQWRFASVRNERAVKIGAEQLDSRRHKSNLRIDSVDAIRHGFL